MTVAETKLKQKLQQSCNRRCKRQQEKLWHSSNRICNKAATETTTESVTKTPAGGSTEAANAVKMSNFSSQLLSICLPNCRRWKQNSETENRHLSADGGAECRLVRPLFVSGDASAPTWNECSERGWNPSVWRETASYVVINIVRNQRHSNTQTVCVFASTVWHLDPNILQENEYICWLTGRIKLLNIQNF